MVVTVGGGLLTRAYLPGVDGMVRALLVVEVLFGLTLAAAPWFGSWSELGVKRPREPGYGPPTWPRQLLA